MRRGLCLAVLAGVIVEPLALSVGPTAWAQTDPLEDAVKRSASEGATESTQKAGPKRTALPQWLVDVPHFCDAISETTNELKKDKIWKRFNQKLKKRSFARIVGQLWYIETDVTKTEAKISVALDLPSDWPSSSMFTVTSPPVSPYGRTYLRKGSKLFAVVSEMEEGDCVEFSADNLSINYYSCPQENLLARFTQLKKVPCPSRE